MTAAGDNWLSLDLQDRRYIMVVDETDRPQDQDGILAGIEASDIVPLAPIAIPLLLTPIGLLAGVAAAIFAFGKSQKPKLEILRIKKTQAGAVDFEPDDWVPNLVYAAHPRQPTTYYPLATFHEQLLLHKIAELERLLNALGAKEYAIVHRQSSDRLGEAGTRIAELGEVNAGAAQRDLTERQWSGTSKGHAPRLPEDLVWYESEPEWRNLVESRFAGSRRRFAFSVRHDQDFGVDARMAQSILAASFEIGGRFKTVSQVEFSVTGTF